MSGGITHVDLSIYNSVASNLFNLSQDSTRVVNHLNAASSCLSGELASCVDLSGYVSACNQIGESYSKVGSAIKQSIEEYIKADEEARSEIQGAEETGIEEKPKNFLSTLCVGVTSILSGVVDIVDSVVDAGAMIVGEATSAVVGLFDQDAATNIKQGVADYVSVDWGSSASKWFYEDTALGKEINATSHITYDSGVATGLRMAGTIAGNIALNFLPGGAIVTGVASAAQAMGRTGEKALNEGATLDQAFGVGVTNAGVGFVTGYFGGQFASQARSALSFTQLGGIALKNAAVQMIEPVADVTSQYLFYKKGQGKSWADVAQEENLGAQLAITGVMAAGSTFLAGYKNVKNAKAEQKLAAAGGSAVAAKETGDAIDSLGQSDTKVLPFEVHWQHQAVKPEGTAVINDRVAFITPAAPEA